MCRLIGDRQSLVIYAQTDPVPIDDALAGDRHATQIAAGQDRADARHELAAARTRLFAVTEQTVRAAAGAEQPAVSARWWVAVPYLRRWEHERDSADAAPALARSGVAASARALAGRRQPEELQAAA